jgi:hypothetical protein
VYFSWEHPPNTKEFVAELDGVMKVFDQIIANVGFELWSRLELQWAKKFWVRIFGLWTKNSGIWNKPKLGTN